MKKLPTTKDFIYWIIGLVIAIIYLATVKLTKNSATVEYISFAATLISIILAIVAMVYAYMQGNQSSKNNTETQSVLTEIKTHVTGIGQLKTDIAISNEGIKDVKALTDKLISGVNYVNQSDGKIEKLVKSKVDELTGTLDFQIICIPIEYDFKNPKKIDETKLVHDYIYHYRKISGDSIATAFNVVSTSDFGFSFNVGTYDLNMKPNIMKNIMESYENEEVKIFTVARLIFAD